MCFFYIFYIFFFFLDQELLAHNTQIVLERTILNIVEYYKNYPNIYFPIRSDQRGRLYCIVCLIFSITKQVNLVKH